MTSHKYDIIFHFIELNPPVLWHQMKTNDLFVDLVLHSYGTRNLPSKIIDHFQLHLKSRRKIHCHLSLAVMHSLNAHCLENEHHLSKELEGNDLEGLKIWSH